MTERFFDIWSKYVIGNKEDLEIGLAQLEAEIRADERRKFAEWLTHNKNIIITVFDGWHWDTAYASSLVRYYREEQKNG